VVIVPRRGMFVTDIGISDLQQLFEVRLVLESLAARLAARRGGAHHWQRMAAALDGLSQGPPNEALIDIDKICHELIYEAADNEFLRDTLVTHYALSLRLWYYFLRKMGAMRGAVIEHVYILEALRAGDADQAAQLMEKHIRAFQEEIQGVMLGAPQPADAVAEGSGL